MDDRAASESKHLLGHSGPVYKTSFSQDKTLMVSSSEDATSVYHLVCMMVFFLLVLLENNFCIIASVLPCCSSTLELANVDQSSSLQRSQLPSLGCDIQVFFSGLWL